jgi:uncharacterized protein involved in exopolysaccharide biosynthesis
MDSSNINNRINEAQYEEIDLREIARFFDKNKIFIIKITLLAAVIAFVASYSIPKVYKIDSALEVGLVGEADKLVAIEDTAQLKDKIDKDIYGRAIKEKLNIGEEVFPELKAQNSDKTRIFYLSMESSDTERAKQILEEADNIIVNDHKKKIDLVNKDFQNNIDNDKKNIERINNKIKALEGEKNIFEDKIGALERISVQNQDLSIQYSLLNAKEKLEEVKKEIEDNYLQINSSEKDINALQLKIDGSQPTIVVKAPEVSEKPVKPRIVLYTLLAAIMGFGAGVMFVFSREWLKK